MHQIRFTITQSVKSSETGQCLARLMSPNNNNMCFNVDFTLYMDHGGNLWNSSLAYLSISGKLHDIIVCIYIKIVHTGSSWFILYVQTSAIHRTVQLTYKFWSPQIVTLFKMVELLLTLRRWEWFLMKGSSSSQKLVWNI